MSITIGWWAVPLALSLLVTLWAWMWTDAEPEGGDYSFPVRGLFALPVWLLVVLGSWLIWALLG